MILCFVDEIQSFHYSISALDHIWEIPFPDQNGSWHLIRVVSYRKHIALFDMSGKQGGYEFEDRSDIKPLEILREYPDTKVRITYLNAARAWLKLVKKDWIAAWNYDRGLLLMRSFDRPFRMTTVWMKQLVWTRRRK